MLKQKISCLTRGFRGLAFGIKGSLTKVSTHVVSILSVQALRFSMQTALRMLLIICFPNLAFILHPVALTINI